MNKIKLNIWGREFDLDIEYDCYSDEEILQIQKDAIRYFISESTVISDAECDVKKYCIMSNLKDIGLDYIDNIFKYVIPKYLYVKRDEDKRVVAIMCNYKFDIEHGIAIVFENERLTKIGKQEIIL